MLKICQIYPQYQIKTLDKIHERVGERKKGKIWMNLFKKS